ncbi:type VI secretion system protein TssA [Phytopseudomonas dryadis]|uniref:type VI secretion system protein TssA n=1 Tax=Phytopseudomonas dryadis TaxID=2487520 RepID=UPI001F608CCB|nr:type VI secretion system protein TssA [Pseudomonas dryadis]
MNDYVVLDLEALLAPLDEKQPAGYFEEEDETFQGIEEEMAKLGSLHEPGMDWAYIDEAAREYLTKQCKHLRVTGHLITAGLRTGGWQAWAESTALLAGMVERYWESAYPKPGATGYLAKRRIVAVLLERLKEALPKLDPVSFSAKYTEIGRKALESLRTGAAGTQLDGDTLAKLTEQLARRIAEDTSPIPPLPERPPVPGQRGGKAITEQFFSSSSSGGLQLGNERESRKTLLTVADFVNQQDVYDPAGYQLRRFALWAHLHAAPSARHENRTELHGVPADTVGHYEDALGANVIDPLLLQRIEKSVASSPYWIRGSFLAASVAERLEMREVAAAIRHAVVRFVRRLPTLQELSFHDGRPFIDVETARWITASEDSEAQGGAWQEYGALREELIEQLDGEGVEVVLLRLQELQGEDSSPRQRCYATVIAAELLAVRGLSWLAEDLYTHAIGLMESTSAEQWEPELHAQLSQRVRPQAVEPGIKG